jgi:hypothetical protein
MGAFYRRGAHDAIGGATAALDAFGRIELPYRLPGFDGSRQAAAFAFAAATAVKSVGTGILIA